MKKLIAFLIFLLIVPSIALGSQVIHITDASGDLEIPDGFVEIPSEKENDRIFYNQQGECVMISVFHLEDIYPIAYEQNLLEGKTNEPFYYDGGGLAGIIGYLLDTYKETGLGFSLSLTNREIGRAHV